MLTSTKLALAVFVLLFVLVFALAWAPEPVTRAAEDDRNAITGGVLLLFVYPLWVTATVIRAREFFVTLVGRVAFVFFCQAMPIVFFAASLFGRRPRRELAEYQ